MGTPNDQAVLQAIFNPDSPFGDIIGLDPGQEAQKEVDEDGVFPRAQLEQSKALELQGVIAAEAGDLSTALERFGQAINLLPERASAYNNRAQARRLQGDVAGALEDLERALALSGGWAASSPGASWCCSTLSPSAHRLCRERTQEFSARAHDARGGGPRAPAGGGGRRAEVGHRLAPPGAASAPAADCGVHQT